MPVRKARYDHIKIWRPKGTKYAHASVDYREMGPIKAQASLAKTLYNKFIKEFGDIDWGNVIIEFTVTDYSMSGSLMELPAWEDGT